MALAHIVLALTAVAMATVIVVGIGVLLIAGLRQALDAAHLARKDRQ